MTKLLTALLISLLFCTAPLLHAEGTVPAPVPSVQTTPVDPMKALLNVLENDAARAKLVEALKQSASPTPAPPTEASVVDTSIGRILGDYTLNIADQLSILANRSVLGMKGLFDGTYAVNWPNLMLVLQHLLRAVAIVLVLALPLRALAGWGKGQIAKRFVDPTRLHFFITVSLAAAADFLHVLMTWGLGSIIVIVIGDGHMQLPQSLFLNAYLLTATLNAKLRLLFSPRHETLRIIPCSTPTARRWTRRLGLIGALLGYGLLLCVPIVNMSISFVVGITARFVIVAMGFGTMVWFIHRSRAEVSTGLHTLAAKMDESPQRSALAILAQLWHIAAYLYITVAFFIWLTRPFDAISYIGSASALTVLACIIAFTATTAIGHRFAQGLKLPRAMEDIFPTLGARLNLFVPLIDQIAQLCVLALALAIILDAWTIVDISGYLRSSVGREFSGRLITAALILLSGVAIWLMTMSWVELKINPRSRKKPTARVRTLYSLFLNAFTIAWSVLTVMLFLSELGLNIAPLLAGAGVLGLAIGFGSQKLVQDIITGAFIQFENVMNEGDVVTVAGISGVVERLSIRSVGLRDMHGVYHVIPFSSVSSVSNSVRGFAWHVAEVPVGFDADIEQVKAAMEEAFAEVKSSKLGASIIDALDMHGIVQLSNNGVVLRARLKTTPGNQWAVGFAYTEALKRQLDARKIPIPSALTYGYLQTRRDESEAQAPIKEAGPA